MMFKRRNGRKIRKETGPNFFSTQDPVSAQISNIMILLKSDHVNNVNHLTQEIYDTLIELIILSALKCPCGNVGFHGHGTYVRCVKLSAIVLHLTIRRVRCPECGKTHALIPDCLIPWSQIPLETTILLIRAENQTEINQIKDEQVNITDEDVHNVRIRFRKFWKERMISYGIEYDPSLTDTCVSLFGKQFMQIRSGFLLRFMQSNIG